MKVCGITDGERDVCFDILPDRKRPCLVIREGNTEVKYGCFTNVFLAEEFMRELAEMIGCEVKE